MKTGYYKIAEKIVEINSLHKDVHALCNDYRITETSPDIVVRILQEDIDAERKKSSEEDRLEGIPIRDFSDSYLETIAVYRKLVDEILAANTILFHGSVIAVDGMAYLFTAKSGTGKSTHVSLWKKLLGKRAIVINDDKPLLHIENGSVTVYGTPWSGKHNLNRNISVPLKAVCILEQNKKNSIERCEFSKIFPLLYQQTYKPGKTEDVQRTMELLVAMSESICFYHLKCNMEIDAAVLSWNTMRYEGNIDECKHD